jgi:hypothetical protein
VARLVAAPGVESDPEAQRRILLLEFQVELIEERMRETVGASD